MITSTLAARTRPRCRLTRTGPRCGAPNDAPTPTCYRTRIGQLAVTAPDELYDSRLPGLYAIAGRDCDRVGVGDDAPRLRSGLMFTQPPPPATIPAAPARAEADGAHPRAGARAIADQDADPGAPPTCRPPAALRDRARADAPASRAGWHSRRGRPGPDQGPRTGHTVHRTTPFTGQHGSPDDTAPGDRTPGLAGPGMAGPASRDRADTGGARPSREPSSSWVRPRAQNSMLLITCLIRV
jgi:hypothetical protein